MDLDLQSSGIRILRIRIHNTGAGRGLPKDSLLGAEVAPPVEPGPLVPHHGGALVLCDQVAVGAASALPLCVKSTDKQWFQIQIRIIRGHLDPNGECGSGIKEL